MKWRRRGISGVRHLDRMLAEKDFRMRGMSGWNGGRRNSGSETPGGMAAQKDSGCDMSGWNEHGYE